MEKRTQAFLRLVELSLRADCEKIRVYFAESGIRIGRGFSIANAMLLQAPSKGRKIFQRIECANRISF